MPRTWSNTTCISRKRWITKRGVWQESIPFNLLGNQVSSSKLSHTNLTHLFKKLYENQLPATFTFQMERPDQKRNQFDNLTFSPYTLENCTHIVEYVELIQLFNDEGSYQSIDLFWKSLLWGESDNGANRGKHYCDYILCDKDAELKWSIF